MQIKQQIQEQIKSVLADMNLEVDAVELTHPQVTSQGDYATNVAMVLFSKHESGSNIYEGNNPRELAQAIVDKLMIRDSSPMIQKIEVAGPGFINFYLKQEYFINELSNLLKDNKEPLKTSFTDKKVMVEFTDPNPFKEFHIGHLYSNTVGESISRLIEAGGAEVKRANYQGDVGLHVAKAIWGMQAKLTTEIRKLTDIEQRTVEERAKWLGEAYALGASAYDDATNKEEIIAINKQVYTVILSENEGSSLADSSTVSQNDISELYQQGRAWSLDYFDTMYERLGTEFAFFYFESNAGPIGLELVREYLEKGIFTESEGAVVFKGEDHGLHTRVFINSLGLPTYEAKELGLATKKYADFPFDLSISITGNEINEYFKVLLKVLSLIKPDIAEKTRHISHGMVRLPQGKMSSRTGNVLTGEWLLNEAKTRLAKVYPEMTVETLEQVTIAAIKWALLRTGIGKDISFNIDESISFEGDSGPYIQYTHARTQSVLGKALGDSGQAGMTAATSSDSAEASLESLSLEPEELSLLKILVRFDEVVIEAGKHYSPNSLTNYLFDLAQTYNFFYQKLRILDAGDQEKQLRLALTKATGHVLRHGLYLLGIKAPEKM